jgi:hypothetical protein
MTDLATRTPEPIDLAAIEAELRPQSTEKLKLVFIDCYNGTAALMARAAVALKLMRERDENATRGLPMVGTFLRIASGQILPEVVWQFIESPNRRHVERLPLPDQKRIAVDPMVPVVVPRNDKRYSDGTTVRMVDLRTASPEIVRQVAAPEGLRSPDQQVTELVAPKFRVAPAEPEPEPVDQKIQVRLTADERKALRHHAADAGITDSEMARTFLRKAGAFRRPRL